MPAVSGYTVSVEEREVSSFACCFRVDSVSGSEGGVIVCLLFQGTQCQWKKGRCHRLPAVSGWIVSVRVNGGVIVCLLFQGGYISVSGSE